MQRVIKFRGQRINNNEWVYGCLIVLTRAECGCYICYYKGNEWLETQVKPETVGQFTGLTDKNGAEVYEGDKVLYRVGKIGIDPVSIQYLIIYYIDSWCFLDTRKKVKSNMPKDFALSFYRTPKRVNQHTWSVIEVIGNIHETPVK